MTCQAEMDYRFGWRWLLPTVKESARMYAFTADEEQFWRRILFDVEWGSEVGRSKFLLVNIDRCATQAQPTLADIQAAELVCAIGDRKRTKYWRTIFDETFPLVREYSLLPPDNPRVIIPLSSVRHAVSALSLHRPGRWVARLAMLLASVLAFFGNFWLLRGRVLLIATRSTGFIPRSALQAGLPGRFDQRSIDYALYLGTPDDNRKTIVLPLGDLPPSIIFKVAETPRSRASLTNEASALSALLQSPLASCVPKLEDLISSDATLTLYQEYRPRRPVSQRKLDAAVINFLGKLMALNRQSIPLSVYLQVLPEDQEECADDVISACRVLRERLQNKAAWGVEVLLHRTHGDFAPWNCAWTNQGLFVFDWEESEVDGLALQDAFYYVIAPALLVQRNASATETLNEVFCFANQVVEASGMKLDIQLYFALWLLTRSGRAKLYGELCVLLAQRWQ